ncbi:zinc ribbon domain-containing protein [Virgibacillus soli]|uniref:Zinc ribbon domain-containing protein n=1 Tax=Paracerasibacillus soli TaxID=480284 RepID=A0ABU5CVN0_9BACI|nr:zinc ribbon domain-containing protein [Virgibacillus soli]MDY0410424.1 zinc ribbon domain-containing protein [Virgibacillus soli]
MICSNCGKETAQRKFCTHCGANIMVDEPAATAEPSREPTLQVNTGNSEPEQIQQVQQDIQSTPTNSQAQQNEAVEKLKATTKDFGHFFLKYLKSPNSARHATAAEFIPAIILMVIFSLITALLTYFNVKDTFAISSFLGTDSNPFVGGFLKPLCLLLLFLALMVAVIFGAIKLTGNTANFKEVFAKYTAYSISFLLLTIIGQLAIVLEVFSAAALITIGISGLSYFIPTFILFEKEAKGIDRVYILLGIYIIGTIASGYMLSTIIMSPAEGFLDNIFG